MGIPGRQEMLTRLEQLAAAASIADLINETLDFLDGALDTALVSYNEIDFAAGKAAIAIRPFDPAQVGAAHAIGRDLAEHPVFGWYQRHPGWQPVRLSDAIDQRELERSRLFRETLEPIGARYTLFVPLSVFTTSGVWVHLAANRADRDFDGDDVRFALDAQPALVAAFRSFRRIMPSADPLTPREHDALAALARGETASQIAGHLGMSVHTVHTHLERIYRKLDAGDRLSAVLTARSRGLLREEDIAPEFRWDIQFGITTAAPDPREG